MKSIYTILIFLVFGTITYGQNCTGCTITINSGSNLSMNINGNNGDVICITDNVTFTGDIQNLQNGRICIDAGATWTPSSESWVNGSGNTVDVYGTFNTSASNVTQTIINVEAGGQLNTFADMSVGGSGGQVNVKSSGQWTAAGKVVINGKGPGNAGALIVEDGATANFNGGGTGSLENNEGKILIAGEVNVFGEFYNHGEAEIESTGIVNTNDFRMTLKSNGIMQIDGRLNVSNDANLINQGPTGSGFIDIGGDLSMSNSAGLGGTLSVRVDGQSTLGQCTGSNMSSGITFCDSSPMNGINNDFDNNNCSAVVGYTIAPDCATLPVELIYFKQLPVSDDAFILEWGIASAIDFSHFEVQESENGKEFNSIEKVIYEDFKFKYESKQHAVPPKTMLYRLKMMDLDESYEYSEMIAVSAAKKTLRLYPNPTNEDFVIIDKEDDQTVIVNIYSTTGKLLRQDILQNENRYEVKLPQHSSNIYIVEMISGNETSTIKVLKQ